MSDALRREPLKGHLHLFVGRLYNHDYLWFSSTEISKTSTTLPYLHNYALCYALAQFERGTVIGSTPTYADDLAQMPLYATPATIGSVEKTLVTFNAVDALTLRTDIKPPVNTPDLGQRTYLNPIFERRNIDKPTNGYTFYLFTFNDELPRSVFRLGKKGCSVRVRWSEIESPQAEWSEKSLRPTHPVNPLDVGGKIIRYEPVMMPPHLLMRIADIQDDWFVRRGPHVVHLPKRVVERIGLQNKGYA